MCRIVPCPGFQGFFHPGRVYLVIMDFKQLHDLPVDLSSPNVLPHDPHGHFPAHWLSVGPVLRNRGENICHGHDLGTKAQGAFVKMERISFPVQLFMMEAV